MVLLWKRAGGCVDGEETSRRIVESGLLVVESILALDSSWDVAVVIRKAGALLMVARGCLWVRSGQAVSRFSCQSLPLPGIHGQLYTHTCLEEPREALRRPCTACGGRRAAVVAVVDSQRGRTRKVKGGRGRWTRGSSVL